jgi:ubiquinone/menaquinone biosynthesis C-methylase UbiE
MAFIRRVDFPGEFLYYGQVKDNFHMVDEKLDFVLQRLNRIADLEELLNRKVGADEVFNAYAEDDTLYQKLFPSAAPIHISLTDEGQVRRDGYSGQARIIQETIEEIQAHHVLELCSGRGYNLMYLAKQNAQTHFEGVDLMPAYVRTLRKRSRPLKNISCRVGNIEALEYPSGGFDIVFCVESLFHVTDLPKTLSEAYRVLKPGGRMIVIDFFRKKNLEAVEPSQRNAMRISENAFAITNPMSADGFLEAAQNTGFTVFDVKELSNRALPDLIRLDRLVGLVFIMPPITGILARLLPSDVIDGIVGWQLLPPLFRSDLMGYFQVEFSRE